MRLFSIFIVFLSFNWLYATIRTVGRNGVGQYVSIQSAITASVSSDTILVFPAMYIENINYSGKNITIASLELTTGNPAYRDSTIIDGNYGGSCVRVISHENNAAIYGFTIQHGSGTPYEMYEATLRDGGGIRIQNATNFRITNCLIKDCRASSGGGIAIMTGTAYVKGLVIRNNYVSQGGGGILVTGTSNIFFDNIDRCSVYENYAGFANDILCADTNSIINVYLDTITVLPISNYYVKYNKSSPSWFGNFGIVDILQGYRTEVNHDLYLSPDGNDSNDGFSPATPKKSIIIALHTIASDSQNAKTIYLAPGIYSSANGQMFPLNMKPYVKLVGDSLAPPTLINERFETTIVSGYAPHMSIANLILDHGNFTPIDVFDVSYSDNSIISNFTINHVSAIIFAGLYFYESKCELNNINLNGLSSIDNSGLVLQQSSGTIKNLFINDCHNTGNEDQSVHSIVYISNFDSLLVMENISITNCTVSSALAGIFSVSDYYEDNPILRLSDVLVANNTSNGLSPILISHIQNNTAYVSNCSFVNNTGTTIAARMSGKFRISNCIFDNFNQTEVYIRDISTSGSVSQIDFNNNLIEGYPASVYVHPSNQVNFNEFNFSADPGFAGIDLTDPFSYKLNSNSPCINAGTADTTGLYLPEVDLFGNSRIYNGIIDIGCSEWDGTANQENVNPPETEIGLKVSPNPFIGTANIGFVLPQKDIVRLDIYNIKGQKVKAFDNLDLEKGLNAVTWDGRDNQGKMVSSGMYLVYLRTTKQSYVCKAVRLIN